MNAHGENHTELGQEELSPRTNLYIWGWFIGLGVGLYLLIAGLSIMFHFQVDSEELSKVGMVKAKELVNQRAFEAKVLAGEQGVVEGKKFIPIEVAMDKTLQKLKR